MPTFYPESIDIDVEEFVDDCSSSEIEQLVNYLKENGLYPGRTGTPSDVTWNEEVSKLIDSKWKLSTEDEATILRICNKLI